MKKKEKKEKEQVQKEPQPKRRKKTALLIASTISGLSAWLIGYFLYNTFYHAMPRHHLVGLVFAVLYLVPAILALCSNTGAEHPPLHLVLTILAAGGIFALASLAQWLYAINYDQGTAFSGRITAYDATSYVFVMDDSGSNSFTDPTDIRYSAISSVLSGVKPEFPYMVYSFADDVVCVREMAPASAGSIRMEDRASGGTMAQTALAKVLQDHASGVWSGGKTPRVILMSDGMATDKSASPALEDTLQGFAARGITVSTVGLGNDDRSFMQKIARETGGDYVHVEEVSDLFHAMVQASGQAVQPLYEVRTLFSTRRNSQPDLAYGVLRILLAIVLGIALECLIPLSYGLRNVSLLTRPSCILKAVLGAVLLEAGLQYAPVPGELVWLLVWLLWANTMVSVTPAEELPPVRLPKKKPAKPKPPKEEAEPLPDGETVSVQA